MELFATSLPADAWPAEDVVALYFGRGAMENRFAQEDREIGIDRTFSDHPPGQEWMSGIGLFLWNLLIGRGVAANPLPAELPAQATRVATAAPEPSSTPVGPPDPPLAPTEPGPSSPTVPPPAGSVPRDQGEGAPEGVATDPVPSEPPAAPVAVPAVVADEERELRRELWSIARKAFDNLPLPDGWALDDEHGEVRCPNGERLFVYATERDQRRNASGGIRWRHRIMVRTDARACDGCPFRADCTSAERNVYKQVARSISAPEALRVRELLGRLKKFARKEQIRRIMRRRDARRPANIAAPTPLRPLRTTSATLPPGPLLPAPPLFLPAASRHFVRGLVRAVPAEIVLIPGRPRRPPAHPLLAATPEARRHQRLTWTQRANRWIYCGEASLCLGGGRRLPAQLRMKITKSLSL